jgi:hypothetical protein
MIRLTLAFAFGAVAAVSVADTAAYSITAHIVSNGSSVHASSACFGLDAVIAEPVAGFSSGGGYSLGSGFSYAVLFVNDTLFANGFEDCSS